MSIDERLPAMRALVHEYLEKNGGYIVPGQLQQIASALAEEHGEEFMRMPREWRAEHGISG